MDNCNSFKMETIKITHLWHLQTKLTNNDPIPVLAILKIPGNPRPSPCTGSKVPARKLLHNSNFEALQGAKETPFQKLFISLQSIIECSRSVYAVSISLGLGDHKLKQQTRPPIYLSSPTGFELSAKLLRNRKIHFCHINHIKCLSNSQIINYLNY